MTAVAPELTDEYRAWILAEAARLQRSEDPMTSKDYETTPIGRDVVRYFKQLRFDGYANDSIANREPVLRWLSIDHADLTLGEITAEHLRAFLAKRWADSAPGTRGNRVTLVRAFFKWAYNNDVIPSNPARSLKTPKKHPSDRQSHEIERIRTLVASQPTRRDRIAILLLYWLALRRGELRRIQFRHIDLARHTLTVYGKGGTIAKQNLPDEILGELERYMQDEQPKPTDYLMHPMKVGRRGTWPLYADDVIWRDKSRPLTDSAIFYWWRRCLNRAGLEPFPMHEMRHTAGTHFYEESRDIYATQHFMRHQDIKVTAETYLHPDSQGDIASAQGRMPRITGQ